MKLSELIAELQEIYEENGDLPVFTRNDEFTVLEHIQGCVLDVFELDQAEQDWGDVKDEMSPGESLVWLQ